MQTRYTLLGLYRENEKENGNYYDYIGVILGLYRDSGKENGSYYLGFRGGFGLLWQPSTWLAHRSAQDLRATHIWSQHASKPNCKLIRPRILHMHDPRFGV